MWLTRTARIVARNTHSFTRSYMASPVATVDGVARGVAFLQSTSTPFEVREYAYIEKGGTGASSAALGVCEHAIIKTLLFQESEDATPFVVLQHGDASVDTKKLIKELGRCRGMASGTDGRGVDSGLHKEKRTRVFMTTPETATKHTGYQVGGTSPFGLLDGTLRVFMESSLLKLLPAAEPVTVAPTKPADQERRAKEVSEWDTQIASAAGFIDFCQLDTRAATSSTLDLVSPAWVLINGGARGTLVALSVRDIVKLVRPIIINVAKFADATAEEKPAKPAKANKQAQSAPTPAPVPATEAPTPVADAATSP